MDIIASPDRRTGKSRSKRIIWGYQTTKMLPKMGSHIVHQPLLYNPEGSQDTVTSFGPILGLTAGHNLPECTEELEDNPLQVRGHVPIRVVWKDCRLDAAVITTGPEFSIRPVRVRDAETLQYGEAVLLKGYPGQGGLMVIQPILHPYYQDAFPPYLKPYVSSAQEPELQQWTGRFVGLIEIEEPKLQNGFQELVVVAIKRPSGYVVKGMSGGVIQDARGNYLSLINFWFWPRVDGTFHPSIQEQFGTHLYEELVAGVRVDHIVDQFGQGDQSSTESALPPIPCLNNSC